MYAPNYIDSATKGRFFHTLKPVHFTTLASPLLGVGLDHPWMLGLALSKGVIGQTRKDLSMEGRSANVSSSASSSSSFSSAQDADGDEKGRGEDEEEENDDDDDDDDDYDYDYDDDDYDDYDDYDDTDTFTSHERGSEQPMDSEPDCELDQGPGPLLVAMARPGSVSHRALKRFKRRILYGNIENDLPVQYNTCTLMGISGFDRSHFFSADGPAIGQRRNLYHVALQSYMSILFPKAPLKTKWMDPYGGPSPIIVVIIFITIVAVTVSTLPRVQSMQSTTRSTSIATQQSSSSGKSSMSSSLSPISTWSARAMSVRRRRKHGQESQQETVVSRTTEELAQLVADGYQTEMKWTKIGVYLQSDAHVQIIVQRRWYNVDR